jgi:hypothetical protein
MRSGTHTRVLIASLIAGAAGCIALAKGEQPPPSVNVATAVTHEPLASVPMERFLKIRAPGSPSFAPDGTMYVRDWPDGIWQLYRVLGDSAGPKASTVKLTDFKDGLSGYSLSPDGSKILLMHAVGGNENTQISLLDPKAEARK